MEVDIGPAMLAQRIFLSARKAKHIGVGAAIHLHCATTKAGSFGHRCPGQTISSTIMAHNAKPFLDTLISLWIGFQLASQRNNAVKTFPGSVRSDAYFLLTNFPLIFARQMISPKLSNKIVKDKFPIFV